MSLLSGVPFLAKPATATAWLAAEMVRDVVDADILPDGAMSLLCGGGRDLMDMLQPGDVVAFTGSADTALHLRANPNVLRHNIRFGVEADSLNLCCLGPDVTPDMEEWGLFVREVVREMTSKAGQKCTAIRRILVPRAMARQATEALAEALGKITVGDPRNEGVRMGPLVSKAQQAAARDGLDRLKAEATVAFGGDADFAPEGVDGTKACFVQPTLLVCDQPSAATAVHEVEVFGPVATLMPYDDVEQAGALARRGGGRWPRRSLPPTMTSPPISVWKLLPLMAGYWSLMPRSAKAIPVTVWSCRNVFMADRAAPVAGKNLAVCVACVSITSAPQSRPARPDSPVLPRLRRP